MTQDFGEDERETELSSIAAIFPELVLDPENLFAASIYIPVCPLSPVAVQFPNATVDGAPPPNLPTPPSSDHSDESKKPNLLPQTWSDAHKLSYLPPLYLQITLPDGYPAHNPPKFQLSTSPGWLPRNTLQRLTEEGSALWEEYGRCQVIYAYIDLLQQAAERGFDIQDGPTKQLEVPLDMKIALLDFDTKARREKFEQETFECGVCLEPRKGSSCYRLLRCGHVFCIPCLQDFYNTCITEGDITSVKCMAPDCGRESESGRKRRKERTLNPSELLHIPLEQAMVKRYVELKRKKKLESDKSTVYCPRKWCQGPARSNKYPKVTDLAFAEDSDSEREEGTVQSFSKTTEESKLPPPAERLSICEDCNYAFCRVCLSGWHGEFARCWPRSTAELTAEEKASYDYIRLHTSPCPTCSAPCQKTHGCNHMNCFQCRTHFCYLCSAWLDPLDPYKHFNNKGNTCYQRLWELEEGDEGAGAVRFEGARGWEAAIVAAAEADAAAPAAPGAAEVDPPVQGHVQEEWLPDFPLEPAVVVNNDGPDPQEQLLEHWLHDFQAEFEAFQRRVAADEQGHGRIHRWNLQADFEAFQRHVAAGEQGHGHVNRRNGALAARPRGAAVARGRGQGRGLRRFLDMVERDEEDEWDSDELEEGDEAFVIPVR